MKNSKKLIISCLIVFSLAGCGVNSSPSSEASSSIEISSSPSGESSSPTQTTTSSSSSTKKETLDFYCVNDFHGSITEGMNGRYYESGIKKYFGHLEELKAKDPDHVVILSAGDMFQGSLESNANYGLLVTAAMNAVGFDAMAVGNHEFDYNLERLMAIKEAANFPLLGGNIRKVDKTTDLGDDPRFDASTIIERGGLKIGIVGMIGEGQTTSITSRYVEGLNFDAPEKYAVEEAKKLKAEGCAVTILLIHDDSTTVARWSVASQMKDYFDGIFCGHTHRANNQNIFNVMALQSYCNGEALSHLQLEVGETVTTKKAESISASKNWQESAKISAICEDFLQKPEYLNNVNRTPLTLQNGSLDVYQISDLACEAIYNKYKTKYPDLVLAMQNKQRATLSSGEVTYSAMYKAMPFTNCIVIASCRGSDILNEAYYNETYTGEPSTYPSLDADKYYTVAVIDYLFYHQNEAKAYDYFYDNNFKTDIYEVDESYAVDITFAYVENELAGVIDASNYRGQTSRGFNLYR